MPQPILLMTGQIVAKSTWFCWLAIQNKSGHRPAHLWPCGIRKFQLCNAKGISTTVRSLNTWYHVAGVYNATTGTMDIYVNGTLNDGILSGAIPNAQFKPERECKYRRRTGGYYFNRHHRLSLRIYKPGALQAEIQTI